jgi:hypothetical protein
VSKEYEASLAKARRASARYRAAQLDYRARRIGDAAFIAEQRVYAQSTEEFDAAFSAECNRE